MTLAKSPSFKKLVSRLATSSPSDALPPESAPPYSPSSAPSSDPVPELPEDAGATCPAETMLAKSLMQSP